MVAPVIVPTDFSQRKPRQSDRNTYPLHLVELSGHDADTYCMIGAER